MVGFSAHVIFDSLFRVVTLEFNRFLTLWINQTDRGFIRQAISC